jgi:hypothetical protein
MLIRKVFDKDTHSKPLTARLKAYLLYQMCSCIAVIRNLTIDPVRASWLAVLVASENNVMVEQRQAFTSAEADKFASEVKNLHTCPMFTELSKMSVDDTRASFLAMRQALGGHDTLNVTVPGQDHDSLLVLSGVGQGSEYFRFSILEAESNHRTVLMTDDVTSTKGRTGRCADVTVYNPSK